MKLGINKNLYKTPNVTPDGLGWRVGPALLPLTGLKGSRSLGRGSCNASGLGLDVEVLSFLTNAFENPSGQE